MVRWYCDLDAPAEAANVSEFVTTWIQQQDDQDNVLPENAV